MHAKTTKTEDQARWEAAAEFENYIHDHNGDE